MTRSKLTNNNMTNRKESVNQHPLAVTARSIANWIFDCKAECGVKYINIFVFVFVMYLISFWYFPIVVYPNIYMKPY